jgi:hypothetical protein
VVDSQKRLYLDPTKKIDMNQPNTQWSIFEKIGFRFTFSYFILHIFPFFITYLPFTDWFTTFYADTQRSFIVWVGKHIVDVGEITIFPRGSGDTTYNYVEIFTFFMIAVIVTIVWSFLDRKRKNYARFLKIFSIYVSYYVATIMLSYGFSKVFYLQFSAPSLNRLLQPYGDSSPMGIAWTFMGASKTYTMFSGFAEVIGGFLLFGRRTRTFGALVVFAVMFNVFMMNMSYDIPVKLYSFHLMLMALFVMMLDYKRIFNLFILKKPFEVPALQTQYFKNKKVGITVLVLKIVFVGYASYTMYSSSASYAETRNNTPTPLLYGIYDVENYVVNKDTLPPLLTDKTRWKKMICDKRYGNYIITKSMSDTNTWFTYEIDTIKNTLEMVNTRDSTNVYNFNFIKRDSTLVFEGVWKEQDSLKIEMEAFDLTKFRLTNRGFHWINEYPYNR